MRQFCSAAMARFFFVTRKDVPLHKEIEKKSRKLVTARLLQQQQQTAFFLLVTLVLLVLQGFEFHLGMFS